MFDQCYRRRAVVGPLVRPPGIGQRLKLLRVWEPHLSASPNPAVPSLYPSSPYLPHTRSSCRKCGGKHVGWSSIPLVLSTRRRWTHWSSQLSTAWTSPPSHPAPELQLSVRYHSRTGTIRARAGRDRSSHVPATVTTLLSPSCLCQDCFSDTLSSCYILTVSILSVYHPPLYPCNQ